MISDFGFGTNLVDLAALTAIIGATTAESLVLGSRGAAGLPWAAMSAFGTLPLIKACIAASTPAWLRDTLGVNTAACQSALGFYLRPGRGLAIRSMPTVAAGIRYQFVR
jgi:hypothetical protein